MYFKYRDTNQLKVNDWNNIYHVNSKYNRVKMATLISVKIGIKTKSINKGRDQHFIL